MKKRKPLPEPGSPPRKLQGQPHSRQHNARGISQGIDWGRMHDDDRSTITPHLGRKGGEH